jgi:protein-arginine kinase activator protein McsA
VTEKTSTPSQPEKELSPLEVLQRKLEQAVIDERYEDAAKARDEINRLKHTHTDN